MGDSVADLICQLPDAYLDGILGMSFDGPSKSFSEWCQDIKIDGHDFRSIKHSFEVNFKKPLCIIADTVKGKGVSFMEKTLRWHHSIPTEEEYKLAMEELSGVKE